MKSAPLEPRELELLRAVFRRHPEIAAVKLFGSRAKGTHQRQSDVDLALWGELDELSAEAISAELDALPLAYKFDVKLYPAIGFQPLAARIDRVAIQVYPPTGG